MLCGTSRDPKEGLRIIKILKKCVFKVFNFVKKFKFLKIRKKFFFFVLKCKQKENVHNLNRRWARFIEIHLQKDYFFILNYYKTSVFIFLEIT